MKSALIAAVSAAMAMGVAALPDIEPTPTWNITKWREQVSKNEKSGRLHSLQGHSVHQKRATYYDNTWTGACYLQDPSSTGPMTAVSAVYNVPTAQPTPGGNSGVAAGWVGIDGATCQSGLFQAGVAFVVNDDQPQYWAWVEWFPAGQTTLEGFTVNPGDEVYVYVHADTPGTGEVIIHNYNSDQTTSITTSAPAPTSTLCGTDVEWIVEGNQIENWGDLSFQQAAAEDLGGNQYGPENADIMIYQENGITYSSVSVDSSDVNIQYVGPS